MDRLPFPGLQAFFNTACEGLAKQGFRKSSNLGYCLYRGPKGLKCAIGHVIPDEAYRLDFDNGCKSTEMVVKTVWEINDWPSSERLSALCSLQSCHDDAEDGHDMRVLLRNFAQVRGLSIPPCLQELET